MDGTQVLDMDTLLEEDELISPLRFKTTSSSIVVGSDVPVYPPISRDWYQGPTEQPHVYYEDWKHIDVS